jgi:hypothetical protein
MVGTRERWAAKTKMRRLDLLIGPDPKQTDWIWRLLLANKDMLAAHDVVLASQNGKKPLEIGVALTDVVPASRVIAADATWGQTLHGQTLSQFIASHPEYTHAHAFVQNPAQMAAHHYAQAVMRGRVSGPDQDVDMIKKADWYEGCLHHASNLGHGLLDPEAVAIWLDLDSFAGGWRQSMPSGQMHLHGTTHDMQAGDHAQVVWSALDLPGDPTLNKITCAPWDELPCAQSLARMLAFTPLLNKYIRHNGWSLPQSVADHLREKLGGDGPKLSGSPWLDVSNHFTNNRSALLAHHPELCAASLMPPNAHGAGLRGPGDGFRATQYLSAFLPVLERRRVRSSNLPPAVQNRLTELMHHGLVPRKIKTRQPEAIHSTACGQPVGATIVACMKNEAPFILEWIAYHRSIGVDKFLIYTNDCSDGTNEILAQLDAMGLVEHRINTDWRGKSPQQHALNQSLHEPAVQDAKWVLHIDIDEFVNIKCGDGTLAALFQAVPEATHIAMTWRLFGHGGVTDYRDQLVCEQFHHCAPAYCPKPHSAWGIKTIGRNIAAYEKLGCHRPNRLRSSAQQQIRWVNGSGNDVTHDLAERGWRSNRSTVGYDLVQLNHYALRSAESFLVKRERGRALHVDRDIGLNYWIRMDWSGDTDTTIARHLPRLRAERDRLLADPKLADLHHEAVIWHGARANSLRQDPNVEAFFQKITQLNLEDDERAALCLSLSMDS